MEGRDEDLKAGGMNEIFSLRRPKDFKAGLSSGLKSVGKGAIGGAVGLVAAPLWGASQQGLTGFTKGVVTGVAGAVILPVTGISVGVVQVVRGALNQPSAISNSSRGLVWDEKLRKWVDPPGYQIQACDDKGLFNFGHLKILSGDDYYQLLQVPRNATPEQIKKQYYLLARKWHPDKNVGDPLANARFQQLGEAYQVLSNAALRERYDRHGKDGLAVNFMDAPLFYSCLFGSDMFDYLVGELVMATVAGMGSNFTPAELRHRQAARVEQLFMNLKAITLRYVEDDVEGFELAQRLEVERLVTASFGETLLHCIGKVYCSQADIYLGGPLNGTWARVKHSTDMVRSQFDVGVAAVRMLWHHDKVAEYDKECEARRRRDGRRSSSSSREQQAGGRHQQGLGEGVLVAEQQGGEEGEAYAWAAGGSTSGQGPTWQQQQQQGAPGRQQGCYWEPPTKDEAGLASSSSTGSVDLEAFAAGTIAGTKCMQSSRCGSSSSIPCEVPDHWASSMTSRVPSHPLDIPLDATGASSSSSSSPSSAAPGQQGGATPSGTPSQSGGGSGAGSRDSGPQPDHSSSSSAGPGASSPGNSSSSRRRIPLEELMRRHELEDQAIELTMKAMWATNVVDLHDTLGAVCRRLLYERSCSRAVCRKRALALRLMGQIFQAARSPGGSAATQTAKAQMESAFTVMMEKRMAEDMAAHESHGTL